MYLPVIIEHEDTYKEGNNSFSCYSVSDTLFFFFNDLLKNNLEEVLPKYLIPCANKLHTEIKAQYAYFAYGPNTGDLYHLIKFFSKNTEIFNRLLQHFENVLNVNVPTQNVFLSDAEVDEVLKDFPFVKILRTKRNFENSTLIHLKEIHKDVLCVIELYEHREFENSLLECLKEAVDNDILTYQDLLNYVDFKMCIDDVEQLNQLHLKLAYLFYKSNSDLNSSFITQLKEVLNSYAIRGINSQ